MGGEESRVELCTDEEYQTKNDNKPSRRDEIMKRKSFFKIQQCKYPHPLMSQKYAHNQPNSHAQTHTEHKCTMKHAGYPDVYKICSKCQEHPQKVRPQEKVSYVQKGYELSQPEAPKYNYKPSKYKQKDILAPGPQIPAFYNGFSLPVDRYYKQRNTFTDYSPDEPVKGSPFREESKPFEESIVEEVFDRRHSAFHERREIEFEGYAQNLKF